MTMNEYVLLVDMALWLPAGVDLDKLHDAIADAVAREVDLVGGRAGGEVTLDFLEVDE